MGSDKRIGELAADIAQHWEQRRQVLAGKGMIVAMSRRIAVALYIEIARLRPDWHSEDPAKGRIKVVITGSAADDALLQPHIYPEGNTAADQEPRQRPRRPAGAGHRSRHVADRLRLAVEHTMYVDKPMRGAPLMQAIARVNRTFKDKPAGLVVDYLGVAEDLKSALADYTERDQDNQDLGQDLREQAIPALVESTRSVVPSSMAIRGGRRWRAVEIRPICARLQVLPTGCWVTTRACQSSRAPRRHRV